MAAMAAAAAIWALVGPRSRSRPTTSFRWPDARLLTASIATGVVAGLLALGVLVVPAAALGVGVLAAFVPAVARAAHDERRREAVAHRWPDVLALMRSRIAAGDALPRAFIAAARHAGPPFDTAADTVEDSTRSGRGLDAAIEELRLRFDDPTADRVLLTLRTAHRTGGGKVARILATLGTSLADELRLRRAHHAALTEQRLTAAVALVAPWALLALAIATNAQAAAAYRSPAGTTVLIAGTAATLVGYALARRTARLSRARRVFR